NPGDRRGRDVREWLPCTACGKILRRPQRRTPSADFSIAHQRQSGLSGQTSALESLQNVRHQSLRELAGQALKGGRIFFKKTRRVVGDLILLTKQIRRVLVEDLSVFVLERYFHTHRDQHAGNLACLRIIGKRSAGCGEDCAAQNRVSVRWLTHHVVVSAGNHFLNDRGR